MKILSYKSCLYFDFFFSAFSTISLTITDFLYFRIINSLLFLALFMPPITISILFYFIHSTLTKNFRDPVMHCSKCWGASIKHAGKVPYSYEACTVYLGISWSCSLIFLVLGSAELSCPTPSLFPSLTNSYSCHISLPKTHHTESISQGSTFQLFFFFLYTL